ncbi:MarR family transcriptional regulator [Sphingopyxis sp.]|uniref:MarR family transcriptional regulator n=1 Tax=Sphingopyxis sp. TaxID=1908224 RepID=UPI003D11FB73
MDQAIQMLSGMPTFPSSGMRMSEPGHCGGKSRLLFVGHSAIGSELEKIDGVGVSFVPAETAVDHLRARPVVDLLWLAPADGIDAALLSALCHALVDRGAALVCETSLDDIDRLAAAIPDDLRVEWLVDADATDRRVALAAARRRADAQVVHEVTRDPAMERIDRLQEEVARISRLLGELAGQRGGLTGTPAAYAPANEDYDDYAGQVRAPGRDFAAMPRSFVPEERTIDRQRAKAVRRMLRQRRMREQYFPADLFADPAWDMLLDLYAARLERQPVSVSSLCIAAAVPATTALRWIKTMTDAGLFLREADPLDGRRIFIALSESAFEAIARYFEALEE